MPKKRLQLVIPLVQLLYFSALCVFWAAPSWPRPVWWLSNLLAIAPLWVLFIPLVPFTLSSILAKNWRGLALNGVAFLIIFFGIMGFNIPWPQSRALSGDTPVAVKVISVNMGNVKNLQAFLQMIAAEKPDLIAFQELGSALAGALQVNLRAGGWELRDGLASRFKIRSVAAKSRAVFGGWGTIVKKYELETPAGLVYFFNVHLETPREGIDAVLGLRFDAVAEMDRVTAQQEDESFLASMYAHPFRPVIIAGDFNLTLSNPIFQANWARYDDAFARKGFGFGYTKHTRWYGARIDHILSDDSWRVEEASVGPDIGGDHHPVIARLMFTGVLLALPEEAKKRGTAKLPPAPAETSRTVSSADAPFKEWSLEAMPMMSFAYKILPGLPVALQVKTVWGDWLCLAGTASSKCPSPVVPDKAILVDDGAWHDIKIDVKAAVQSVLPAVKFLSQFEFTGPEEGTKNERLLIDRLKISAAE